MSCGRERLPCAPPATDPGLFNAFAVQAKAVVHISSVFSLPGTLQIVELNDLLLASQDVQHHPPDNGPEQFKVAALAQVPWR